MGDAGSKQRRGPWGGRGDAALAEGGYRRSALEGARAAVGDKDVAVMGGAEIGQQYIRAGLIDGISIHLVPILFGSRTRMFEHLGSGHSGSRPQG